MKYNGSEIYLLISANTYWVTSQALSGVCDLDIIPMCVR